MVERQVEAAINILLDFVLFGAECFDILMFFQRRQLCGRTVFVGCANKQNILARLAQKPRINVGGQHGADQIAQMFDAVDVRQRACNQIFRHDSLEAL